MSRNLLCQQKPRRLRAEDEPTGRLGRRSQPLHVPITAPVIKELDRGFESWSEALVERVAARLAIWPAARMRPRARQGKHGARFRLLNEGRSDDGARFGALMWALSRKTLLPFASKSASALGSSRARMETQVLPAVVSAPETGLNTPV